MALLNPPELVVATSQRVILHRHLEAHGVAAPPLHGVVGRGGGWSASSGRPVLGAAAITDFLAGIPDALIIVPSGASAADDLRVLLRDGSALVGPDGARTEVHALAAALLADRVHELFVVMGLPRIHEAVRDIAPDAALPAVRMTTLVSDAGEVEVVHAFLRPLPEPPGERAHRIDPRDGTVADDGVSRHLPHWPAACELARRAAALLLPQRTIGLDIALTPTGPVVIDAVSDHRWVPDVGFDVVLARLRAVAAPAAVAGAADGSS